VPTESATQKRKERKDLKEKCESCGKASSLGLYVNINRGRSLQTNAAIRAAVAAAAIIKTIFSRKLKNIPAYKKLKPES
jgi:hypothetical protein